MYGNGILEKIGSSQILLGSFHFPRKLICISANRGSPLRPAISLHVKAPTRRYSFETGNSSCKEAALLFFVLPSHRHSIIQHRAGHKYCHLYSLLLTLALEAKVSQSSALGEGKRYKRATCLQLCAFARMYAKT